MRAGLEGVGLIANSMGVLAFLFLWLAVIWGIVLRNGWASTRIRHSTAASVHTTVALLGLCLGVVHAFAVEAGRGEQIRYIDALVPFADRLFGGPEPYFGDAAATPVDRLGVSVGVIALELMLTLAASILIQRRIGYSRWKALHNLSYAAFLLMAAHILITGPGTGPNLIQGLVITCCLMTIVLWLGSPVWAAIADSRLGRAMSLGHGGQPMMTVSVDAGRCERSGFCVQTAPSVFRMYGDGRLTYRASVDATDVEAVIRAAETCPTRAIVVGLTPSSVTTPQRYRDNGGAGVSPSGHAARRDRSRGSR